MSAADNQVQAVFSTWVGERGPSQLFPNEDWNALQYLVSLDQASAESVRFLLSYASSSSAAAAAASSSSSAAAAAMAASRSKVEVNYRSRSNAVPSCTALHIAVAGDRVGLAEQLIKAKCDVNLQDQWGFTPLHYAVVKRSKELVLLLTANGASVTVESSKGSNPLALAKELKYAEIEDILASKMTAQADPSLPMFKEWLVHLGAGEYVTRFVEAGYDLPFIVSHGGFEDKDLDCVGIPMTKLGLRKKIIALHELDNFYDVSGDGEEGEGDEGDEGEDGDDGEEEEG